MLGWDRTTLAKIGKVPSHTDTPCEVVKRGVDMGTEVSAQGGCVVGRHRV